MTLIFFHIAHKLKTKMVPTQILGTEVTSAQVWWSQIPLSPLQGSSMVPNISIGRNRFWSTSQFGKDTYVRII